MQVTQFEAAFAALGDLGGTEVILLQDSLQAAAELKRCTWALS